MADKDGMWMRMNMILLFIHVLWFEHLEDDIEQALYKGDMYIYLYIHTYIHTYVRTYVRTYIHTYIHI